MNEIPQKEEHNLKYEEKILKQSKNFNNVDIVLKFSCFITNMVYFILFLKTQSILANPGDLIRLPDRLGSDRNPIGFYANFRQTDEFL